MTIEGTIVTSAHDHASRASSPIPLMLDHQRRLKIPKLATIIALPRWLVNLDWLMISRPGYAHVALRLDQRLLCNVNQMQRIYSCCLSSPSTEMRFVDVNGTMVPAPGPNHFTLCGTSDRFITLRITADVWMRIG